jgi:hypothetical protein
VFRTVALQQTDPGLVTQSTGDIIAFYNAVRIIDIIVMSSCHVLLLLWLVLLLLLHDVCLRPHAG